MVVPLLLLLLLVGNITRPAGLTLLPIVREFLLWGVSIPADEYFFVTPGTIFLGENKGSVDGRPSAIGSALGDADSKTFSRALFPKPSALSRNRFVGKGSPSLHRMDHVLLDIAELFAEEIVRKITPDRCPTAQRNGGKKVSSEPEAGQIDHERSRVIMGPKHY